MNPIAKIRQLAPRYLGRSMAELPSGRYVSICFDDFPKSAVENAKPELDQRDWKASWYAAFGQMNTVSDLYGRMFSAEDARLLHAEGHDLGCHTYSHIDCSETDQESLREDFKRNLDAFIENGLPAPQHFAYPFGAVDLGSKRMIKAMMVAARGVKPGIMRGSADLGMLPATGIQLNNGWLETAKRQLTDLSSSNGWLIIFTHDVCDDHSEWGCTVDQFRELLDAVEASGADVVTVSQMLDRLPQSVAKSA